MTQVVIFSVVKLTKGEKLTKVEKYRVLGELIETNKRQFVIPVYQRNYDWGKQHCKKLYDDIISVYELDRFHFIGSIVYVDQGEENKIYRYLIIDGQQRITTLFLLLKALLDSTEDKNLKKEFEDILFNIDKYNDLKVYRVLPFNRNFLTYGVRKRLNEYYRI